MIFAARRLLRSAGVLGMNRRNAQYIMQCNPRSAFPLVDDKIRTKHLAQAHHIPTPILYRVIEHPPNVAELDQVLGDRQDFVIKPARGAGGSGIILIAARTAQGFINTSGKTLSREELAYHISDILSGIHSLGGVEDRAIVEALIQHDPVFAAVTYRGVPDIRIVVYRGVPVMGMVRLPTRASEGKANLHRGAIGAGISIGKGVTHTAVHRSRVITRHPETGNPVAGIQVPYWKHMLLMAASTFEMTGLGYLGVDLVIDRERGPLLLELNARPGLAIQLANQAGLLRRLTLVDTVPFGVLDKATERVAWAQQIF